MEPLTNYEVTEQEIKENGVQAVPGEVLYGEPSENKLIFDRLPMLLIAKYNRAATWLKDKAHIHANKTLLDTVTDQHVHEHDNKALLDALTDKNTHVHKNQEALDLINVNLITAWNQSAGIPFGSTDLDCGYFSEDAVAEHLADRTAHTYMHIDGNQMQATQEANLQEHMVSQTAHGNLNIDGNSN